MAPAVRQPPQLEAWPPAAPALPAPSPPACAAGRLQPAGRARRAKPAPAGPASAEPAAAGGGPLGERRRWGRGWWGGGRSGYRLAQQQSLRPGGIRRLLIKSTILQGTSEVPKWNSLKRTANFLMRSQVTEHPSCLYQSVVWRWGGKRPPARTREVLHLLSSLPGLTHTHTRTHAQIYSHLHTHI